MNEDANKCMKANAKSAGGSFACLEAHFLGKFEGECRSQNSVNGIEVIRQSNADWIAGPKFSKELKEYDGLYEQLFLRSAGAGDDKWDMDIIPKVREFAEGAPDEISRLATLLDRVIVNDDYRNWAVLSMKFSVAKKILELLP